MTQIWDQRDADMRRKHGISFESDGSVPHADSAGRFAVLSHKEGKNHNLTRAATMSDAEQVAGSCIADGEWIEGVYDYDTLDAPEPDIEEGDLVRHNSENYRVLAMEFDGPSIIFDLVEEDDWDEHSEDQTPDAVAHERFVRLIDRSDDYEEQREPLFHKVAGVKLIVTFNK